MPPPSPATLRLINLAEHLRDEAQARLGLDRDGAGADALTDPPGEPHQWTEASVRAHYALVGPLAKIKASPPPSPPARPPPADHPDFTRWVPGLPMSRTAVSPPALPAARIVAFPCAGSAEDMYSLEGTGSRRVASPLLDWCRANNVELLAVQPPGRAARLGEAPIPRAAALAAAALPALAPRLADGAVPWFLVGHSAGAWVAYEFALAAARAGLSPPVRAFLSAMLPPDTPRADRPWRQSAGLATADLQDECRAWGMAPAALGPAVWPAFEPLIRADFQLFDEYEWGGEDGGGVLACPLTVFAGTGDGRCPAPALAGWARFTRAAAGGGFELVAVRGPHLWPLDRACKPGWLAAIAARAAADLGLPGPADGWSGGGGGV